MGYIYLITNTINNKRYIGQTIRDNIHDRWNQHKKKCKRSIGRVLLNAYNKYGVESFTFQIVCICFDEDCNIYEEQYIKKYNTLHPNGYNLKEGGMNFKHHPESIEKMKATMKGRECSNKHYWTEAKRQEWGNMRRGKNNPAFGKRGGKMPQGQKEKISESMIKIYKNNKRIITEKQLEGLKIGHANNKRRIGQYDLEGNLIKMYDSAVKASLESNICRTTISCVCRGVASYKTAGGFIWKYIPKDELTR
jgi:group I intron endonuclease